MIFIWEVLEGKKGDLWQTIEFDIKKPSRMDQKAGTMEYDLKCDFRIPTYGILGFPGKADDECAEFAYAMPLLKIHNYMAGKLQDPTKETKAEWEAMPDKKELELTNDALKIVIDCKREIVDPLEHSIEGNYYIYKPVKLRIHLKK